MTDDTIKGLKSGTSFTVEEAQAPASTETKKSGSGMGLNPGEEMGQQEFLTLLVNQLQNQDPLSPMDSDEFSVQLAQFSQLEQLIGINEKLDGGTPGSAAGGDSMATMASFLGHNVTLRGSTVSVDSGSAGELLLDLPEGTQSARIDFTDDSGAVAGSKEVTDVQPGTQTVPLNGLNVPNGDYTLRVVAVTEDGQFKELDAKKGGLVEGFVLEPEPALLVGGETISLEDVVEVTLNEKK